MRKRELVVPWSIDPTKDSGVLPMPTTVFKIFIKTGKDFDRKIF
jgi:hypothetical protein